MEKNNKGQLYTEKYRENYDVINIFGGSKLDGTIKISAAKNAVLPLIAACILVQGECVIHNFPFLDDTISMLDLLSSMNAKVKIDKIQKCAIIDTSKVSSCEISKELATKIRSSIFMLGPMLSVLKTGKLYHPGGCKIGERPIDLHIKNLEKMGASFFIDGSDIVFDGSKLHATDIVLSFPSVGATENLIMASVLTSGKTTIIGPAKEPEIVDLVGFLNKAGAKIYGAGTDKIVIVGVKALKSVEYTPIFDRIEAGTFLLAAAATRGKVCAVGAKLEQNFAIITKLANSGCKIEINRDRIYIEGNRINAFNVETEGYPGFPTDLQAPVSALLVQARGQSVVTENLFEMRYNHFCELEKMGAHTKKAGNSMIIDGVDKLHGANVVAHDLRCGACLVIAGLSASNLTTIENAGVLRRGYENLITKLKNLGANLEAK